MSINNTNKITSLAQSLGSLVINGFVVDYDSNEYGETISVKSNKGLVSLGDFDYENITVAELVKLANNAIESSNNLTVNEEVELVSFNDALNKF